MAAIHSRFSVCSAAEPPQSPTYSAVSLLFTYSLPPSPCTIQQQQQHQVGYITTQFTLHVELATLKDNHIRRLKWVGCSSGGV